jgi:hypothetical protein
MNRFARLLHWLAASPTTPAIRINPLYVKPPARERNYDRPLPVTAEWRAGEKRPC